MLITTAIDYTNGLPHLGHAYEKVYADWWCRGLKQIGKPVQLVDGEMISWYGSRAIAGCRYLRQLASDF